MGQGYGVKEEDLGNFGVSGRKMGGKNDQVESKCEEIGGVNSGTTYAGYLQWNLCG